MVPNHFLMSKKKLTKVSWMIIIIYYKQNTTIITNKNQQSSSSDIAGDVDGVL